MKRLLAHRLSGYLDISYGRRLFLDRSVPVKTKMAAMAVGCAATAGLVALEIPLESVMGILLPFVGEVLDVLVDGIEVIVLPMLIASAALPHLLPKQRVPSRIIRPRSHFNTSR
jgi:hypothetical protein